MLLQPKGNTDPKEQFHAPSGMGKVMIQAGIAEEVLPSVKPPVVDQLKWYVVQGTRVEDYQYPPVLFHSCTKCGPGSTESQMGTAHKTTKIFCCGRRGEMCPVSVATQYEAAYAAWKLRSKKPPVPKISDASPASQVRAFGLKTQRELILEALSGTETRNTNG